MWTVVLHPQAEPELLALPSDMQARFLRIGELLEELGPQRVGLPHIRPLQNSCGRCECKDATTFPVPCTLPSKDADC